MVTSTPLRYKIACYDTLDFIKTSEMQGEGLTELINGKLRKDPMTGILLKKLTATGKKPLKSIMKP